MVRTQGSHPCNRGSIPLRATMSTQEKGFSQEKLVRSTDVANNTIIKIESGANTNPTIETISKIAKALNVGVDDLIK